MKEHRLTARFGGTLWTFECSCGKLAGARMMESQVAQDWFAHLPQHRVVAMEARE